MAEADLISNVAQVRRQLYAEGLFFDWFLCNVITIQPIYYKLTQQL